MNKTLIAATAVALVLAGCSSEEEDTSDAITRISYEQAMEFVSETVSETSCEVWAESPDNFTAGFVNTFGETPVSETGQTFGEVIGVEEMTADLEREMEEACG